MNSKLSEIAIKAPDEKQPGAILDNFIELNRGWRGCGYGNKTNQHLSQSIKTSFRGAVESAKMGGDVSRFSKMSKDSPSPIKGQL